jgi:hypothetical protein
VTKTEADRNAGHHRKKDTPRTTNTTKEATTRAGESPKELTMASSRQNSDTTVMNMTSAEKGTCHPACKKEICHPAYKTETFRPACKKNSSGTEWNKQQHHYHQHHHNQQKVQCSSSSSTTKGPFQGQTLPL